MAKAREHYQKLKSSIAAAHEWISDSVGRMFRNERRKHMRSFLHWIVKYNDFRGRLDQLAVGDPWQELQGMEQEVDSLAIDGLDCRETARCLCEIGRAIIFFLERKYPDSLKALNKAKSTIPIQAEFIKFIDNEIAIHKANIEFITNNIDDAIIGYEEIASQTRVLTPMQIANASFNLGNCYMIQKNYPKAKQCFERAGSLYGSDSHTDKVADVYHQIGNIERLSDNIDLSIANLFEATKLYLKTDNKAGMWRVWDDLARSYVDKSRQPEMEEQEREKWAEHAFNAAITAAYFAEELWKLATNSEGRMADLSDQFANHTLTLCETALGKGRMDIFLGALAINKGRIRNSATYDLPIFIKEDTELTQGVKDKIYSDTVEAIAGASLMLSKGFRKIAIIEHFIFGGNRLFIGTYYFGERVSLEWYETELPLELSPEVAGARGNVRCHEALILAKKYLSTLEAHAQRCSMILGAFTFAQSEEDKDQLRDWAVELSSDSEVFGRWFFPENLLSDLRSNDIGHVILIPDPAFATMPYASFETGQGTIVDQPWTLSIATSAMEILRIAERAERLQRSQIMYYVAPDSKVNTDMGGDDERKFLDELFCIEPVIETQASIEGTCEAILAGRWVHFRGHGRWTKDVDTSGLVFSDTDILDRASLRAQKGLPGFLVTAACRSGFNNSVGTELFGLLTEYELAGALGALLTAWPIHGPATTYFMEGFYREISMHADVALALQRAMKRMRESNPHPYLWAPFFLVGGWMAHELLSSKPAVTSQ